MLRLIAIAFFVRHPAQRAEICFLDREGFAIARHLRAIERRFAHARHDIGQQCLLRCAIQPFTPKQNAGRDVQRCSYHCRGLRVGVENMPP